ncbi:hypothetical protein ABVT39_002016, partial [Epinephelus coioides]
ADGGSVPTDIAPEIQLWSRLAPPLLRCLHAVRRSHHLCFTPKTPILTACTFWAVFKLSILRWRLVRSHSHITTAPRRRALDSSLPVAMTRGGSSPGEERRMVPPQHLGDASAVVSAVMRPLSNEFTRRWEPDVPAVEPVEHQSRCAIRATETEWHRNRSVATSR